MEEEYLDLRKEISTHICPHILKNGDCCYFCGFCGKLVIGNDKGNIIILRSMKYNKGELYKVKAGVIRSNMMRDNLTNRYYSKNPQHLGFRLRLLS